MERHKKAEREAKKREHVSVCYCGLHIQASATAGPRPKLGSEKSVCIPSMSGADPTAWVITTASEALHKQEAGVKTGAMDST